MKILKNKMVLAVAGFLVLPFLLGLSLAFADIDTSSPQELAELE